MCGVGKEGSGLCSRFVRWVGGCWGACNAADVLSLSHTCQSVFVVVAAGRMDLTVDSKLAEDTLLAATTVVVEIPKKTSMASNSDLVQ